VNQAVGQMDEVTQQNAALVEQAATAAQSLEEQASSLKQALSVFKLADTGLSAPRTAVWQKPSPVPVSKARPARQVAPKPKMIDGARLVTPAEQKLPGKKYPGGREK